MSENNKHSYWGWGTDAYPAQEPQELQFQKDRENGSFSPRDLNKEHLWVVCGNEIAVVDIDNLREALVSLGADDGYNGPFATGTVSIANNWNLSFVVKESNIDLETLHKIFLKWSKDPHINFEEINHPFKVYMVKDKNGFPLPVRMPKEAADPGIGDDHFKYPWKNTDDSPWTDIQIWNEDQGKFPGQGDLRPLKERATESPWQCIDCDEKFDSYDEFRLHQMYDHPKREPTGHEEEIRDMDETFFPDNEASRPGGTVSEPGIHTGSTASPIPFSFDVMSETIYIGSPGQEVDFGDNLFNKAEGYYTPEGDMLIIGHPEMPYAISSLMRAWRAMNPEHEIKQVYMLRKDNGIKIKERVANA